MAANGPNVSLTAGLQSGTGLPPELATRQMQLQVQQQLAEALLAKGMQDVDPVTHGPAGNPFAHDTVNWGGILSKYINSTQGRSELEKLGPQQAAIAAQAEAMRKQDIGGALQTFAGGPTPGPYEGGSIDKAPDVLGGIKLALMSSHPAVQQWGQDMQKAWVEGQMKGAVTPADVGTLAKTQRPDSIAAAIVPGLLSSRLNAGALRQTPHVMPGDTGFTSITPAYGPDPAKANFLGHTPTTTGLIVNPGESIPPTNAGLPGILPNPPGLEGGAPPGAPPAVVAPPTAPPAAPVIPPVVAAAVADKALGPPDTPVGIPVRPDGLPGKYTPADMATLNSRRDTLRAEEAAGAPGTYNAPSEGAPPPKEAAAIQEKATKLQPAIDALIPSKLKNINSGGGQLIVGKGGEVSTLDTPFNKMQTKGAEGITKGLEEGRTQAEAYATLEPTLIKMLHMLPNVDMQLGGDWKNNFRKFLTSINVSTDDQAKIVDMDTYLKYALGPAAAAESQTSGRPSTFMFTSFLKAFAASSEGDPRAAENVVGNMIAGGHNAYEHHLSQLQQASDFPAIGKNLAETYRLPNFPSMDQTRQQLDEAQVIHNIKQNSNGLWVNAKAGDNGPLPLKLAPPPGGNMGPPAPPTLPKGWSYEGPQ